MALRSGIIPSLIQGISQQPAALRLPTQLDLMENCYASAVEGLIRRSPTEHISKVSDVPLDSAFLHIINRDVTERYNVIITPKAVKVFTIDGVEKTVIGSLTDSSLLLLESSGAVENGATFQIAADPGETAIDFVAGGIVDATVKLQGSLDGTVWDDLATRTTDGTTAGIAIGNYVFIRGIISAWVAGTISLLATYRRNSYLVSSNPKADFTALTVADFTFVVNKSLTPAMKPNLSPVRPSEGLVFVRQGNYASRYVVYINGTVRADFTTSATVVGELATEFIAKQLHDDLIAQQIGDSTVQILNDAGSIQTGPVLLLDQEPTETLIDFTTSGITTATVLLEGSVDGVTGWITLATHTTNTTTAGITIAPHLYVRARVSAYTSGTIDASVTYQWGSNYTITLQGSTIHIVKAAGDFFIQTGDSQGGNSLKSFKDQTLRFTDLPTIAPNGFVIGIDSNPDTLAGAYFLQATSNQAGEAFGEVTWQETVAPGIEYIINPATMPQALVRESNGDFSFKALEWANRICGDEDTNAEPSFIGSPIQDASFYKNRLGFLAGEFFIFSQTGEYFNFFRTTVTQILDTDPIDSRAVHTKVSILKHMVVFNTDLMLFSDQTQFKIPGDVAFTPRTFRADPVAEFEGNMVAKPVNAGKSLYFVFNRKKFAGLKNLFQTESISNVMDAEDLTSHTPSYIPTGVFRLAVSTLEGVTVALTDGKPASIFVYKTAFSPSDNKKVQAAWFEWPMGDVANVKVLDAGFIESELYLLVQRYGKVYQERMKLQPALVDDGSDYITCLDRRFDESTLTPTYDIGSNTTLFEGLPYVPVEGLFVVATADGQVPNIVDSAATSVEVSGDHSISAMWFGEKYLSRARPSTIFVRKQAASGSGLVIDEVSRLQLLRGYFNYNNSGYFKVSVTPEGRATSNYTFTGRLVGDLNPLGEVALGSGRFSFAVLSKNDRVVIEVSSDTILPFRITSLEWEGTYNKRSQG